MFGTEAQENGILMKICAMTCLHILALGMIVGRTTKMWFVSHFLKQENELSLHIYYIYYIKNI